MLCKYMQCIYNGRCLISMNNLHKIMSTNFDMDIENPTYILKFFKLLRVLLKYSGHIYCINEKYIQCIMNLFNILNEILFLFFIFYHSGLY